MLPKRKRTHKTDTIVIDSSSESSVASEDSAPESDVDSPSKHGGYAAENDMSQRQTRKINSGNFGMFNRPTLTTRSPRTPRSRKRKRAIEFSAFQEYSSSERLRSRSSNGAEVIGDHHEDDIDMSLFVPEDGAQPLVVLANQEEEDDEQVYDELPPERAQRVKDLQAAETELDATGTEQASFALVLANIETAAENEIADILRHRDETIKLANEHAQSKIRKIREGLPLKKASYEKRLSMHDESKKAVGERVMKARTKVESMKTTKLELERQGGFDLGIDVRTAQSRSALRVKERLAQW